MLLASLIQWRPVKAYGLLPSNEIKKWSQENHLKKNSENSENRKE
jgi:hypothetical protein